MCASSALSDQERQLLNLRDLYVSAYRKGATVGQLQKRAPKDFARRGIEGKSSDFVKRVIGLCIEQDRQLLELRDMYVSLYRQGITIKQLQQRAPKDFVDRGIRAKATGFVEKAIYS